MTTRRWIWAVAGMAVYLAALIALAPAALFDAALESATDGRLRLTASKGSIWSGRGELELRDPDTRAAFAKSVTWRFNPAALRDGRLGFDVRASGVDQPFALKVSWRRLELGRARMQIPAAALGLALPQLAPLELTGIVAMDVDAAVWEKGALNANAAMRWSAAGSALAALSPLGSYELTLECERSVARAALSTLEGALHLSGSGAWTLGERPRFRAQARVPPSHRRELAPLLALVGVEREPGSFELELR